MLESIDCERVGLVALWNVVELGSSDDLPCGERDSGPF